MDEKKIRLSPSALTTLARCGMQAYYAYVERIKRPPGISLLQGRAVHAVTEQALRRKMAGEPLPQREEVMDLAGDAVAKEWLKEPPDLGDDPDQLTEESARSMAAGFARAASVGYVELIAPNVNPKALEHWIELDDPGFPFRVAGRIDVLEADGIRDSKTTGSYRKQTNENAANSIQLGFYSMVMRHAGLDIKWQALDVMQISKRDDFYTVGAPVAASHDHVVMRLEAAAHVFESGAFYPVDPVGPNAWVCTPKFCGYYDRCPYGQKARVQVR